MQLISAPRAFEDRWHQRCFLTNKIFYSDEIKRNQSLFLFFFQFDIFPKRDVSVTIVVKCDVSAAAQSAPLCSLCAKLWSHGGKRCIGNLDADGWPASPSRSRHSLTAEEGTLIFQGAPVSLWDLRPAVLSDRHLNTFLSCCYGHKRTRLCRCP